MQATAIATFIALLFLAAVFVATAWGIAFRLTPELKQGRDLRWLRAWTFKGLALPIALWAVLNLGVSWSLQPFMPQVQWAKNNGQTWIPEYLRVVGYGLFIASSYWAAVTLAWLAFRAGAQASREARTDFKALCWTCSLGLLLPAAIVLLLGGLPTLGLAASIILVPLAGYAPGILAPRKLPPMYARAIARMKFGKYTEAEWEIIRELEKSEDDFEGWMMLADLYANHFNDLKEAEQTVLEICDHPKTTPSDLSVALHRLADWQLKLAEDPQAARRSLQVICDRLPGTHLARMAQLRMRQLPLSAADLRDQHSARPIPLPALGDSLDAAPAAPPGSDRKHAAAEADECIQRLRQDPNNPAVRERLARLLAERLDQPETAIEQVLLLLNLPDQPDTKRAEWLGLIAAWNLKYRNDVDTARITLERILAEFPHSAQAIAAERRLRLLRGQGEQRP